jgi:hypothetical protein
MSAPAPALCQNFPRDEYDRGQCVRTSPLVELGLPFGLRIVCRPLTLMPVRDESLPPWSGTGRSALTSVFLARLGCR